MPTYRVTLALLCALSIGCSATDDSPRDTMGADSLDMGQNASRMDGGDPGDGSSPTDGSRPRPVDGAGTRDASGRTDHGSGGAPDAGTPGVWRRVWSDEFDGDEIDLSKWTHEVNCWGGGNNEDQCYVDDAKNSFVRDGSLHLVALADRPSGPVGGPGDDQNVVTKGHSSARLVTQGNAQWTYGRMEARIKLPCGQGLWPAFWMMPASNEYGGWAASGEIDIMEAVNLDCGASAHEVHGTLHYGGSWPNNVNTGAHVMTQTSAVTAFHEYAVEWEPGVIRWFVDGVHFATQSKWCSEAAPYPAPFDAPFFFIFNVAVGGAWPGPPNASTSFPQTMEIDYVRVYQCDGDMGCGTTSPDVTPVAPLPLCNTERVTTDDRMLWLYEDGVNRADWPGQNSWSQNPGKVIFEDVEEDGDVVWSVRWTDVGGGGNLYIQSTDGQKWDLRNFAETGRLELEIKVISLGDANALFLKIDSEHPALGQINILDQVRVGEWVNLSIPLRSFLDNPGERPLDLGSVWTPFVLEPSWASSGVEVRLNDIRWVRD